MLLVAAAVLIVWLLKDSRVQWDLTQNQRNTLVAEPRATCSTKMKGPIKITAYATTQDPHAGRHPPA